MPPAPEKTRRGTVPPAARGVKYWDAIQGKWRYRPKRGKVVDLHSPEGERAYAADRGRSPRFSPRQALRRAGALADRGAGAAASGGSRLGGRLVEPSAEGALSFGELLVYVGGSVIALGLLEAALSGRGPAAIERVLGLAGSGMEKLFSADDPIFGKGTVPVISDQAAGGSGVESQAVANRTAGVHSEVSAGVQHPSEPKGKIIGRPFQGTHAKAFNVAGGTDNWQSENAYDIALPKGTPLYAVVSGVVGRAGPTGESGRLAGNRVNLTGGGNSFYYAHLERLAPGIHEGAHVRKGQLIGYSGEANGVLHLHFAALHGDPARWLRLTYAKPAARRRTPRRRGAHAVHTR